MTGEYDWMAENDARTIREYGEIVSDPGIFSRAKQFIMQDIKSSKDALKRVRTPSKIGNPATIGKLSPIRK